MDLISVIVPVYQVRDYLCQCLDSILAQTYNNLEIILVDDGSTDGSGEICDVYARKDSRIRVIHKENGGLVSARKAGLKIAKGKYVGFVDSDDWIDDDMYAFLYKEICRTNATIVVSSRYIETKGKSKVIFDSVRPGIYYPMKDEYFCYNMIFNGKNELWGITPNFWNKLFKRDHLLKFEQHINNEITYGEDDACVYPCMAFASKVVVTNACFYHYRLRDDSMSASGDEQYFIRVNLLYLAMKRGFRNHPLEPILMKRLSLYMFEFVMRGINGLWDIDFSFLKIPQFVLPPKILPSHKIVLYGAGKVGKDFYKQLAFLEGNDNVYWVDKNYKNIPSRIAKIHSPNSIKKQKYECVIVAINDEDVYEEIYEDLIGIGVDKKKIFWSKPVGIMKFLKEMDDK